MSREIEYEYVTGKRIVAKEDILTKLLTDGNLIFSSECHFIAAIPALLELNLFRIQAVYPMSTTYSVYFKWDTDYQVGYISGYCTTVIRRKAYSYLYDIQFRYTMLDIVLKFYKEVDIECV